MANTLILRDLLQADVERELEKQMTIKRFCNRQYEGELKQQGNTVVVPIVPNLTGTTGGTAGSEISINDTALSYDSMVIDQRYEHGRYITDYEAVVQNFALRQEIARKMAYDLNLKQEDHIFSQLIANIYSTNQLNYTDNTNTGATVASTDVYDHMLQMKEVLMANDVDPSEIIYLINPSISKLIKMSDMFDSTDYGAKWRVNGTLGKMVDGGTVLVSNNIPRYDVTGSAAYDSTYMFAFQSGAINFVEQLSQFDARMPANAFRVNLLMESIYKADVLTDMNKKRLVAKKVTNMTFTS